MTRPLTVEDLYRFAIPGDPALSADGERIAYTLTTQDADADRPVTSLWQVRTDGGIARRLTSGPADIAPRWSPDGTVLAFLRQGRLHLLPADGGEAVPLTNREEDDGAPVWSPDGSRIAFSAPESRPVATEPVVIDRLGFKADGAGLLGPVRSRLFVVDAASGETRQLTGGDFDAGQPTWSPDGTRLAFPAAVDADADVTAATGAYVLDVDETGARPRPVGPATGLTGPVGWFPDATALLVTGRTTVTAGHLGLFRRPLDGSAPTPLTGALDRNVMPGGSGYPGALPQFHGERIVFCARDRGATRLYRTDVSGTSELPLPAGTGVSGCSVADKAGRAAVLVSDRSSFGEVALLDLATGELTRLTGHTAQSLPDVAFHPVAEREFTISDGTRVHAMITRDPLAPAYGPLLVDLHGGPHNAWAPGQADPVHLYHHELVSRGWTVLTVNVRGSDGYGEDFFTGAVGAWGEADEKDILEPVAVLVAEGLVDPARIALTGYSYGGFLACWLSARSDIFAAVVPGGVVTDLTSMEGTTDMGQDLIQVEFPDRERLLPLSPLSHLDEVRAPTLILHGGADDRCPVGQAEQWFHGLRVRDVPVRLVLYPGGSHLFILSGRPSHRIDYSRRIIDWVTEHTAR